MTDFKPGTVATGKIGEAQAMLLRGVAGWYYVGSLHGGTDVGWCRDDSGLITDIRPLVVIDPDDYEQVRNVVQNANYLEPGALVADLTNAIQRGLKAIAPKQQIPEPGIYGVVEASTTKGVGKRRWVRLDGGWHSSDGINVVAWQYLVDPILIREGVDASQTGLSRAERWGIAESLAFVRDNARRKMTDLPDGV